MGEYHIIGGRRLRGEVVIGGSKNAALPILAAAVLGKRSVIHNCPKISDVECTMEILRILGCVVEYNGHTAVIDARGMTSHELPKEQMTKMRSSMLFTGGLLSRFGQFFAYNPGGCELGKRPINLHLDAFRSLGAEVIEGKEEFSAKADKLEGCKICLKFPSVGATQNIMIAATLTQGVTTIENAAKEPEVVDLQNFLVAAGAKIAGAGTSTIVIEGVRELHDVEYTIMSDRIVAGTYLTAAAITQGSVRIKNVVHEDMRPIVEKLADMGAIVTQEIGAINLSAPYRLKSLRHLETNPHPAFPTDMQPQIMTLLATAHDNCTIEEAVFEARDKHVPELVKMGAQIKANKNIFHIQGVAQLHGTTVCAKDLRGGAALILAGLAAQGKTIVKGGVYVERGYEAMHKDLQSLGADIKLTSSKND